ncbi:MAG: hypothetical protein A2268_02535 [Candidatus Raymondbacteria bacterium RifOxyA12_full_50_37]|uniref:histidine kinase n=1 Tax=Candidatus Raymondbacteria bacterium RIFOXYD12_FULL_49_13 TaxID=1817890 RepID=A0A1F7FFC4_UNCRA|nr:MAG: hypothetical protein A2268_02535 [Candidatus Raymondbacteria bacterium RifOxyA12_full_50_37]OGJ89124.1 MAG: hypothetical protein A2248_11230 [Candidatus Raymondbacteria bacterium RIFOXYA2_FULL_49_16]OGJ96606.1 MAG: hypothetical protein A2453_06345 [Candidatus Raymondbacteria bacterium RIFOXYC2_FULL_50_21]OGK03184.1 MAG: hypothetical protein A2350_13920 [Candidatus Raymondbacteria bacterium RifOxyB12_full_50_8]OGK05156.1 MAG: hypothetical protein A2519_11455 [Candidatus Raymondbacteria b
METEKSDLQPFMDMLPVGVCIFSPGLQFRTCNTKTLELFDIGVEDLLLGSQAPCFSNEQLMVALNRFARGTRGVEQCRFSVKNRHLQAEISRAGDNDIVLILSDISHYKQMESLKTEFVSILLHKIRNPLTSIKTSLAMLSSGKITGMPDNAREIISLSHTEVNRLTGLLNDLKNTFIIDTGLLGREIEPEVFKAMRAIHKAVEEIGMAFPDAPAIASRFAYEGDMAAEIAADFDKMRQALGYIFKNALAYSRPGTKIRVLINRETDHTVISIRDKGEGISDNELPYIFEKYYRAANATQSIDGHGLGLYITRAFIESFGGSLYCESKAGEGASFHITLKNHLEGPHE